MPDTFFALSVLILLLLPGVIFAVQIDNRRPTRDLSPLREIAAVAGVGALCDFLILLLFGVFRALFPRLTPDVGSIVRFGTAYIEPHYISVGWWVAGLLVASCSLAYLLGRYRPGIAGRVASGNIAFTSAWWELFHMNEDSFIYVGCELQDGSYIGGYLLRYSTEVSETPDRELALSAPISYRPAGVPEDSELENVGAVTVSAGQIKFMSVAYLPVNDDG
jgi:Family of unknown function (DUF6338)